MRGAPLVHTEEMARWVWIGVPAVVVAAVGAWAVVDLALATTPPELGPSVVITVVPSPTSEPSPPSSPPAPPTDPGAETVDPAPPPPAGEDDEDDNDDVDDANDLED